MLISNTQIHDANLNITSVNLLIYIVIGVLSSNSASSANK